MKSSSVGPSQNPDARSQISPIAVSVNRGSFSGLNEGLPEKQTAPRGGIKPRRLVAYQRYFGLEARALQAGAERMLQRMCAQAPERARINARTVGDDFRLDGAASGTLLRAFLAGGLLYPDGDGGYEATERFREYALARVVMPLSRARAKALIDTACRLAVHVNANWDRNPFLIERMLVSGSYMSHQDLLTELSLWLVPRYRPQPRTRHLRPSLSKGDALHQIHEAMTALSSFMLVRMVPDKEDVQRPFSVVFQANEDVIESSSPAWERLRDWGVSISRRVVSRQANSELPFDVPAELVTLQRGPRTLQREKSAWGTVGKRGER